MLKLISIPLFFILSSISNLASAALIVDKHDYFISFEYTNAANETIELDWVWASSANVNHYYGSDGNGGYSLINTFNAPSSVVDPSGNSWRTADTEEFDFFSNNITIQDFTNAAGGAIHGMHLWNVGSLFVGASNKPNDFVNGEITSNWLAESHNNINPLANLAGQYVQDSGFDVFFVRLHSDNSTPVPEPSTLLIFSLAIIGFTVKSKKSRVR